MPIRRKSARKSSSSAARRRAVDPSSSRRKTKTDGAIRGGAGGSYHYNMAQVKDVPAGTGYSTSHGGVVEGKRMLVGYIHKPRGTGSRMPTHKNEQFNFVVPGTLVGSVNAKASSRPAEPHLYPPKRPENLFPG